MTVSLQYLVVKHRNDMPRPLHDGWIFHPRHLIIIYLPMDFSVERELDKLFGSSRKRSGNLLSFPPHPFVIKAIRSICGIS